LIPRDQFIILFPDKTDLSEHDLTIARIRHEHQVRLELEEQRQALLKTKQALIVENSRRKEDLVNLDKELEKYIKAADPIVKTLQKEF